MELTKKFIFGLTSGVLALSMFAGTAFADADAICEVGHDGVATCWSDDNDSFTVDNENDQGDLFNADLGVGVSGGNDQSDNEDDNSMGTGGADGDADSDNFLNSNVTVGDLTEEDGGALADASVGHDGSATADAEDNDSVEITNDNEAYLENLSVAAALSGGNTQSSNEDRNSMTTGDSDADASADNTVNSNWTEVSGWGSNSAFAEASVGHDGEADAEAEDEDSLDITAWNDAEVYNATLAVATSGGNDQSDNEDDNSMGTGGADGDADSDNFLNSNVTVGDLTEEDGGALADASVGHDGSATADAEDNDSVEITNDNEAYVENISAAEGVSGENTQSGNEDGNTMTTGQASGSSCSTNTVNSNWTVINAELPEGGDAGC